MSEYPAYLYHYTSIQTLGLILKNQTVRFNRLDLVDDMEESQTSDFGNLGRFSFVSCWTSRVEESIPMWKMYSEDMKGIRIKLPVFPFKKQFIYSNGTTKYDIGFEKLDKQGCLTAPITQNLLVKVRYDDDQITPSVYMQGENFAAFSTDLIGKNKRSSWEFQKEWRYKFFVYPVCINDFFKSPKTCSQLLFSRLKTSTLPFNFWDVEIDPEAFDDMEIMLGPKAGSAERILVEALVEKLGYKASIVGSALKIR